MLEIWLEEVGGASQGFLCDGHGNIVKKRKNSEIDWREPRTAQIILGYAPAVFERRILDASRFCSFSQRQPQKGDYLIIANQGYPEDDPIFCQTPAVKTARFY